MKKIYFCLLANLFSITLLLADYAITRGPAIGEIYYIGPTVTGQGIYHSTDFGQTATCMDSTLNTNLLFMSITADLTQGVLYGFAMPENLYISYNYGQQGSWIFRSSGMYIGGSSGRNDGEFYNLIIEHSNDYGINFTTHAINGFFGNLKGSEIDNQNDVGYATLYVSNIPDSLYFLITYDNFENLEIQYTFQFGAPLAMLSRGHEEGEIYLYTYYWGVGDGRKLRYSNDYGQTWELKNTFNCPNLPITCIVGGRQPGELYMNVEYIQLMHTIQHTYIYHSLDYGQTFEVFHTFSYGDEPFYANFTSTPDSGNAPLTVQFTDISSGVNNQLWQWDFNGDGEIDSNEQNPVFTYQFPGTYNASLTIFVSGQSEMTATREIIVTDSVSTNNSEIPITNYKLSNHPNPFNPTTTISYNLPVNVVNPILQIFNIKGERINQYSLSNFQSSIIWDVSDSNQNQVSSGVYIYRIKTNKGVLLSKKMLLLK
ncbi:MAG: PKD domain-containing protein [Candidatus Tenebribacter burtonii]|nr:PKD domain-containing protein [Candidatus Tenebribacter burtonii]